jgi:hypothetical protein
MKMVEVVAEASLFIRSQAGCGLQLACLAKKKTENNSFTSFTPLIFFTFKNYFSICGAHLISYINLTVILKS